MPVMQALELASNFRDIKSNRLEQPQRMDKSPVVSLYCSLLQGSPKKTKLRKGNRFTDEQEGLMENCFDMVKLKRKIDTHPNSVSNCWRRGLEKKWD